jgi:glycosyltransferase involved in cell wall biosynthesis
MKKNTNMRVAMLGHKRVPSREGGIEVVVEELSTRMAAQGIKVTALNRSGHHVAGAEYDSERAKQYKGIHIKYVPTINKKGLAAVSSSFFACMQAGFGPYDVVHIHAEGPAYFAWIPKLLKKRVIVTVHGLDWQRAKWGNFASRYIKAGEANAVKYADEIIVLSRGVQDYFRETYHRETVFIPNGVAPGEQLPADLITKKWGLEKDGYILFVGRLVPEKGIKYLLEAWRNVKTDKKLVFAGMASDTEEFRDEIKALADDRVIFTGFTVGQELKELYSNAYVYCLPSDLEGMPLTLLEAMSYGNCCLVSSISECTEVVEDKAVVFEKSNVQDLRDKLQELIDHPETVRKYKEAAEKFITEKYNWDEVVEKTLELYRDEK